MIAFGREMLEGGCFGGIGIECCSDRRLEIPEVPCGLIVIFPGMLSSLIFPRMKRFTPIKMWEESQEVIWRWRWTAALGDRQGTCDCRRNYIRAEDKEDVV